MHVHKFCEPGVPICN